MTTVRRQPTSARNRKAAGTGVNAAARAVNDIIVGAMEQGATDIHIARMGDRPVVRYRIKGELHPAPHPLPADLFDAAVSLVRVMAGLGKGKYGMPEDGRFSAKAMEKDVDFLVSIAPTIAGPSVTMRLLDKSTLVRNLAALGLPEPESKTLRSWIARPWGIVVVGGPTGSGKTTTLYALLQELAKRDLKIISIEDPVHYRIDGVSQFQVDNRTGLTYEVALKCALRQDVDVLLVDEIKTGETAAIAVKAALTGHVVLTTLHIKDSASGVRRFLDLGIEPLLLAEALVGVSSQVLFRKICKECKEEYTPSAAEADALKGYGGKAFRGRGCPKCSGGFKGRGAILELLDVDEEMKRLIMSGPTTAQIREQATKSGMATFREKGVALAKQGIATIREVLGVTPQP